MSEIINITPLPQPQPIVISNGQSPSPVVVSNGVTDASFIKYSNSNTPSLVNVQQALDQLLYVPVTISTFVSTVNTAEKGSTVTTLTLSWTLNKNVVSQSISPYSGEVPPAERSKTLDGLSLTADTTFTLTVNDEKNTVSKTLTVAFRNKRYWGTTSKTVFTSADVLALSGEFSTSRAQTRTMDGNGQYLCFVFPSSFGTPIFKVNGLQSTAWNKQTISFTNASGYTESYDIWLSDSIQNGTGILVEVT